MIVSRIRGPVAEWTFTDEKHYVASQDWDALHHFLAVIQGVAEILEAYELLFPAQITLFQWISHQPQTDTVTPVIDEPDVCVTIPRDKGAHGIVSCCEEILRHLDHRPFLYPVHIELTGTGIVFDANGQRHELPDTIWMRCYTLAYQAMSIMTQSDAWLPYTLHAEPQPQVQRQNAIRLEAALLEIEQYLDIDPVIGRSDYSVIDGYNLHNYRDPDGDPEPAYLGDDDEYVRT